MARINWIVVLLSVGVGFCFRGLTDLLFFDIETLIEEIKSAKIAALEHDNPQPLNQLDTLQNIPDRFIPQNEYQVKRWQFYEENNVYDTDMLGIGEPRIGLSGEYKQEIQHLKVFIKNQDDSKKVQSVYMRSDSNRGMDYLINTENSFGETAQIEIVKPLVSEYKIFSEKPIDQVVINLICPVSHVAERLTRFLEDFNQQNLKNVKLLIVSMNEDENDHSVKNLMKSYKKLENVKVLEIFEKFSRGIALNFGTKQFKNSDLLLFIDVDMLYTENFLNRCRSNAIQNTRVFFPIPWSQYNPEIIKKGNPYGKPEIKNLSGISKWTGYWIHYGYGMVCLYKSDFVEFEKIHGWGGEDVEFFKKMVEKEKLDGKFQVMHSVEPGLVHKYHERVCDKGLTSDQFRMCVGAMADTLGNKQQLGVLYLDKNKNK